ncbi:MAG: TrmH family RNA methyltransferase [Parachlamydiales bacterium]|nr:TrmH family RNA methyltransferase [Parachlamydiales bacterium]
MNFTKKKFLELDYVSRHKKSAQLLRRIYDALLEKKECSRWIEQYNAYATWNAVPLITEIEPKMISDLYHFHLSQAQIHLKEYNLLPSLRKGDHAPKQEFGNIAIYLDNLRSAYNVGSIFRTTEALRLGTIYCAKNTPDHTHKKVIKTSMHTASFVPCRKDFSLEELPRPWIALDTSDQAISLEEYIFPPVCTLILGNEEYGISDEMLSQVDHIVEIPLVGHKNSINVAAAFAIAAFALYHQHSQKSVL